MLIRNGFVNIDVKKGGNEIEPRQKTVCANLLAYEMIYLITPQTQ
jgi:hypothetical protein